MAVNQKESARLAKRLGATYPGAQTAGMDTGDGRGRVGVDAETISRASSAAPICRPCRRWTGLRWRSNALRATCYRRKGPKRPAKRRPLAHGISSWGLTIGIRYDSRTELL